MDEREVLRNFLDRMVFVYPNLNDCFGYACADTEKIYMDDAIGEYGEPPTNIEMLVDLYLDYGESGILAFVGAMRNAEPLKELQDEDYHKAVDHIKKLEWKYWED